MSTDTDQYGVAGHPISHSWSPFIHTWFARETGQAMSYRLYDIPPAQFAARVRELFASGVQGLNITLPHKIAAVDLTADLTERAAHASAVNTLVLCDDGSLLGDNTDGTGLLRDLRDNIGLNMEHWRVLLVGAGGAARGALAQLLAQEPAEVVIANRSPERAEALARAFAKVGPVEGVGLRYITGGAFDLIINTTSAGIQGATVPLPASVVSPDTICYDMHYGLNGTPFCRWSQAQGCSRAFQGWGMLVEQAAESFYVWRGVRPDTRGVLEALHKRAGIDLQHA
jgi:shikimate dehydrogenase